MKVPSSELSPKGIEPHKDIPTPTELLEQADRIFFTARSCITELSSYLANTLRDPFFEIQTNRTQFDHTSGTPVNELKITQKIVNEAGANSTIRDTVSILLRNNLDRDGFLYTSSIVVAAQRIEVNATTGLLSGFSKEYLVDPNQVVATLDTPLESDMEAAERVSSLLGITEQLVNDLTERTPKTTRYYEDQF